LVWQWHYRIGKNLEGLTLRKQSLWFSLAQLFFSCIHYLILVINDPLTSFPSVFLIGFTGDVLGCFIVLYVIKGACIYLSGIQVIKFLVPSLRTAEMRGYVACA
jgi:hypothetical protein